MSSTVGSARCYETYTTITESQSQPPHSTTKPYRAKIMGSVEFSRPFAESTIRSLTRSRRAINWIYPLSFITVWKININMHPIGFTASFWMRRRSSKNRGQIVVSDSVGTSSNRRILNHVCSRDWRRMPPCRGVSRRR